MAQKTNITCNFYAIIEDGAVRKINLTQLITQSIKNVFIENGNLLIDSDTEPIEFDGNYLTSEGEVNFVSMLLPDRIKEVALNSIGILDLDLATDKINTLFWHENDIYYFQNFDNRKLLNNKNVIYYNKQTYSKLEENAFIVENYVNAVFKDNKFYFFSYANANKIFSLIEFYEEATELEIRNFSENDKVSFDENWLIDNSNSIIRKQISLIQKNNILSTADTKKIKSSAKKFKLGIDLDTSGKIILPKDKKICKDILSFLNEQFFFGVISGNKYKTNSKRTADIKV